MAHDPDSARAQLHQWIVEQGSRRDPQGPTGDADLQQEGWIDSLGLMTLIIHVEELLGRELTEREMRMQNFASIDSIVRALFAPAKS